MKSPNTKSRSRHSSLTKEKSRHAFYDEFHVKSTDDHYINTKHAFRKSSQNVASNVKKSICGGGSDKGSHFSCKQLLPISAWLAAYRCAWFKRDLLAGLTVAILLVPQSLAYAQLAGLPPEWGLYASSVPVLVYVLWSTSTQIAVGPVAPTAIMVASAVEGVMQSMSSTSSAASAPPDSPEYQQLYQSIAMSLSFVCGVILVVFGLIRAGFIIVFLSRPVMTGFIASAALIILVNQFRGLLGLDIGRYPLFYETLYAVLTHLYSINWYTTLISCVSVVVLFLPKWCKRIPKWVPIPLVVMVGFILISAFADLEALGVAVIGSGIGSGFPTPAPPDFGHIAAVLPSALIVAIVSYMGSIALAKGFEQKTVETYQQEMNEYNQWCKDNNNGNETNGSITGKQKLKQINDVKVDKPKQTNTADDDELDIEFMQPETNGGTQAIAADISASEDDDEVHATATAGHGKEANGYQSIPTNGGGGAPDTTTTTSADADDDDIEDDEKDSHIKQPTKPLSLPPIDLDANMEFIASGLANVVGAFLSCQVISASFSRSALNFEMSAHSQMSSVIQALVCLLCLLFLMPFLAPLPLCVLASVVAVSVHRLIKNGCHECRFLWRVSRMELVEFVVALCAPLVIGLEVGIFLAIGTSIGVNLLRHSFASIVRLGKLQSTISDDGEYVDCELYASAQPIAGVAIVEMKAELAFTNNNRLVDRVRALLAAGHKYIVVSLNLTSFIDTTSIRQIVTIFEDAKHAVICLAQCRPRVIELIKRYERDADAFPTNVRIFISTHDAVRYLQVLRRRQQSGGAGAGGGDLADKLYKQTTTCEDVGDEEEDSEVQRLKAKHNSYSIRARARRQRRCNNTSYSSQSVPLEHICTDSEEHAAAIDEEEDDLNKTPVHRGVAASRLHDEHDFSYPTPTPIPLHTPPVAPSESAEHEELPMHHVTIIPKIDEMKENQ